MQRQAKLCTPKITLHFPRHYTHSTFHPISSHLSSSHLISPHLISPLVISFHLISSLLRCHLSSSQLFSSQLQKAFTVREELFYTKTVACRKLLHRKAVTRGCVYTRRNFYTQKAFTHGNLLQTEAISKRSFLHRVRCGTEWQQNAQSTSKYYLELQSLHK